MFLTRMPLNRARRQSKTLLTSPHAMHAAVLSAFPPEATLESVEGRVLWRLDTQHPHVYLYVVSPARPVLDHLVEQAGWPEGSSWETVDYGPRMDRLASGDILAFRLTANPVRRPRESGGKRVPHVTALQQTEWLLQRVERHGFRIPRTAADESDVVVSRRDRHEFRRGGRTVTLVTAQFDGRLEITDATAFRRTLTHGIGSAKGYGCGLLTVTRPAAAVDRQP